MSGTRATIKESAMSVDLQQDCIDCAAHALHDLHLTEQTSIAQFIKKELDMKYGHRWHCIVGHSFGGHVSHDGANFIYFLIDNIYFMIWRVAMDYEEKLILAGDGVSHEAETTAVS